MFAAVLIAAPVLAASVHLDIAAGRLGPAVLQLGARTGASVGISDPRLRNLPTPAVHGRLTPAAALGRLLRNLPARAVAIDATTFRIVRAPPASSEHKPSTNPPSAAPPQPTEAQDIVVTASKRGTRLSAYPGSATVLGGNAFAIGAPGGSEAILAHVPALSSTQLGPGRNKLFIGGVADSSFNGPTQATVGQYLGELRLNYNAPDPDLVLYDVASVELLEGPQGTLYGAGSLGGIVRILPNPVNLDRTEGMMTAGLAATAHGAGDSDVAAMLNLPLVTDKVGVRGVAYRREDGGYIDDTERGLTDINRTRTVGGRAALDAQLGGWSLDATFSLQNIDSADGQYAERGLTPLTQHSTIAQPFDNDYLLGGFTARRSWGATNLVSATAVVHQSVDARYDFTPAVGDPRAFDQGNRITLVSNETRLSRDTARGFGWLIGTSFLFDTESLSRTLGGARITGVRNDIAEGAIYGELSWPILRQLVLTGGGRVSFDHLSGQALDLDEDATVGTDVGRDELRVLPSAALSWRPTARLTVFARYEEGFRPGGLSVASEDQTSAVQRFRGDSVGTIAVGVRLTHDRWDVSAQLSSTKWKNIQADLVDVTGLPFTANLGVGRIRSAELRLGWRPVTNLALDASLAANDSELDHPDGAFAAARDSTLPNIPDISTRAGFTWSRPVSPDLGFTFSGWVGYVGRSRLGVGPTLDIGQGGYVDNALTLRLGATRAGMTLSFANLADSRGNRFGFGDPFTVAERRQITPLTPRTIRLGFDARF